MCLPTIHFQPPPPILKRGETGREWGEQQENSGWDSAARSVVARAERMACCVGQRRYCVSGLSLALSLSLSSVLSFMSIIPPFKQSQRGISSSGRKESVKRKFLGEALLRTC